MNERPRQTPHEYALNVFDKVVGVNAYERVSRFAPKFLAIPMASLQVIAPITIGMVLDPQAKRGKRAEALIAGAGINAEMWANILIVAFLINKEPIAAITAKTLYNAGAAILPDAIRAARNKFRRNS